MAIDVQRVLERHRQGDGPIGAGDWLSRLGLRFRPDLEEAYLRELTERKVPVVYVTVGLAAVLMLLFLAYDMSTRGRYMSAAILAPLGLLCGGGLLLAVLAIARRRVAGYPQWVPLTGVSLNILGHFLATAAAAREGVAWPQEMLFVNFLYLFFFVGLSFRNAFPVAVLVVVAYGLFEQKLNLAGGQGFDPVFFLFTTAVLAGAAGYLQELGDRESWLRGQRIHELSQRDALTDLLNHRSFFERAEASFKQARREKKEIAVLLGDVDHFKKFNDTHGHMASDLCLRRVAQLLSGTARRPLDLVGRLGGEEFAILFYGAERAWVMGHAEDLRAQVAWMDLGDNHGAPVRTSISIGLAFFNHDQIPTIEQALRQADAALYRAKHSGRDRIAT